MSILLFIVWLAINVLILCLVVSLTYFSGVLFEDNDFMVFIAPGLTFVVMVPIGILLSVCFGHMLGVFV